MIEPISIAEARNYSALQLAFIGDAVYNLVIRLNSLKEGKRLREMHLGTTGQVNAVAQAKALRLLEGELNEEELEIVRRGRNAHPKHQAPRCATSAQYSASTGFEALIGFHYLTGQTTRLDTLFSILQKPQQT
jgi:ribonuclease-3 family protein